MPSSVNVGGIRTSTIATSGALARDRVARSSAASPTAATTSCPRSASRRTQPVAQQDGVFGDDDAHGSSATIRGPAPAGSRRRASRRGAATRAASPARPVPRVGVGAADAVVARPRLAAAVPRRAHVDAPGVARGVLGDVRQRLGDDEVGGRLDRRRRPRRHVDLDGHGNRRPRRERRQRRVEAAVVEDGRREPADEVAELDDRRLRLPVRAADELARRLGVVLELLAREAEVEPERDEPLLRAVVEVALDPPPLLDRGVDRAARVCSSVSIRSSLRGRRRSCSSARSR